MESNLPKFENNMQGNQDEDCKTLTVSLNYASVVPEKIHTREEIYKCQYCDKAFTQKSEYIQHERIHIREKPYKCQHCDKAFTRKLHCIEHERVHTGEKPYKCQYCDKQFTKKHHCTSHERIHTGEKPYKCQYCDMTFSQKGSRIRHESIHTGKKQYECQYCNKTFAHECSRIRHENLFHKDGRIQHESLQHVEKLFDCPHRDTLKSNGISYERKNRQKTYECELCYRAFFSRKKCDQQGKDSTHESSILKSHTQYHIADNHNKNLDCHNSDGVSHTFTLVKTVNDTEVGLDEKLIRLESDGDSISQQMAKSENEDYDPAKEQPYPVALFKNVFA
ncbi:zinc finger protein 880 [Lingula anatina]|uniref:Zinc finger protein 880 n=1 Tax=Lingula anatina TaxID=7574 RepID=A0A1S3JRN0_LINAN|nr:zinc finger protein 880 [Lingula anatina]|eukprot:XP_013412639.1 zinc finger protein 880 [Lingula anatina]